VSSGGAPTEKNGRVSIRRRMEEPGVERERDDPCALRRREEGLDTSPSTRSSSGSEETGATTLGGSGA
jgi:hypothetical protein